MLIVRLKALHGQHMNQTSTLICPILGLGSLSWEREYEGFSKRDCPKSTRNPSLWSCLATQRITGVAHDGLIFISLFLVKAST